MIARLKRLKMARIWAITPELLQVAKTQRWLPEVLRTEVTRRQRWSGRAVPLPGRRPVDELVPADKLRNFNTVVLPAERVEFAAR